MAWEVFQRERGKRCPLCNQLILSVESHTCPLPTDDERHGTVNGYSNWKCRCAPCTEAWRVACAGYRRNRTVTNEKVGA